MHSRSDSPMWLVALLVAAASIAGHALPEARKVDDSNGMQGKLNNLDAQVVESQTATAKAAVEVEARKQNATAAGEPSSPAASPDVASASPSAATPEPAAAEVTSPLPAAAMPAAAELTSQLPAAAMPEPAAAEVTSQLPGALQMAPLPSLAPQLTLPSMPEMPTLPTLSPLPLALIAATMAPLPTLKPIAQVWESPSTYAPVMAVWEPPPTFKPWTPPKAIVVPTSSPLATPPPLQRLIPLPTLKPIAQVRESPSTYAPVMAVWEPPPTFKPWTPPKAIVVPTSSPLATPPPLQRLIPQAKWSTLPLASPFGRVVSGAPGVAAIALPGLFMTVIAVTLSRSSRARREEQLRDFRFEVVDAEDFI